MSFHHQMLERGMDLFKAGDLAQAKQIAETLVAEQPNDFQAMALLGGIHFKAGDYGTALTVSRMVLNLAQHSDYWYNLAGCLNRTYHKEPAIAAYDKAAALAPDDPDIWESYSGFWVQYGNPALGEQYARRCIELNPHSPNGNLHLGMALLLADRWQEAWPHMEYRKKRAGKWLRPTYPMIEWTGERCDTLLIHGEQGLGDELMYCSLAPRIMDMADRVVVECNPRLVSVLRRSLGCEVYGSLEECAENGVFGQDVLDDIANKITIPGNGTWEDRPRIVAMGSLPAVLNLSRDDCADSRFLVPDLPRAKLWRARLQAIAGDRPIIGVAWQGGAHETHKTLRNPPRQMFKRLSPEKYCMVSLQYTPDAPRQAADMGMLHFPQAIADLDEHASLIAALDCVVSVAQTSMHFAGALGIPTLALINQYPKWDCGREGPDVPWWRSVKAIRQRDDDWTSVFDRLLIELGEDPRTVTDRAAELGPLPNLSLINIGGADASQIEKPCAVAAQ